MKVKLFVVCIIGLLAVLLLTVAVSRYKLAVRVARDEVFSIRTPGKQQGDKPKVDTVYDRLHSLTNLTDVNISSTPTEDHQQVAPDVTQGQQKMSGIESAFDSERVPDPVSEAAASGLVPFLKRIPEQDLPHYGFTSRKEFAACSLKTPFRMHVITPNKILGFEGNTSLSSLISATELWLFPIEYGNEYRTLLTVDNVDGNWEAVAIGRSGLARDLGKVAATWPSSEGYDYKFIRVYQARSDFVAVFRNGETHFVPLTSASMMLELTRSTDGKPAPCDYIDIIKRLKPVVTQSLEREY